MPSAVYQLTLGLLAAHAGALVFELAPAPPLSQQVFHNSTFASWGGNIIEDANDVQWRYHLFVAAFTEGCGLNGWETNSEVIHAVSNVPLGPYQFLDVALPVWHHNPQIVQHTDGTYLLFSIGMDPEGNPANCSRGALSHGFELIQIHSSPSLYGPWALLNNNTDFGYPSNIFNGTNPAPVVLPNGSIVVASHGGACSSSGASGGLQISRASGWGGPYTPAETVMQYDCGHNYTFEDPFLWFNASAGVWGALLHQYNVSDTKHQVAVGGFGDTTGDAVTGPWTLQSYATPAYNTTVTFSDGSVITYARRERPKLFMPTEGGVYLITSVCEQGSEQCYTLGQQVLNLQL